MQNATQYDEILCLDFINE